ICLSWHVTATTWAGPTCCGFRAQTGKPEHRPCPQREGCMASRTVSRHAEMRKVLQDTRRRSLDLAAPLSDADASAQSMPDASPAKWHLAHTTWFFESFVLRDHQPSYRLFDDRYPYLFNSYYEAEGPRHARARRGLLTRPSLDQVRAWRDHVDAAVQAALPGLPPAAHALIELGIQHEQQHQELLLN